MRISVVITHYKRPMLLANTLETIQGASEIIIVNDNSEYISALHYNVKIIDIKDGIPDTVKAHNIGFAEVTGDVVLINCAECMHIGNIIGYIYENFNPGKYFNFATYSDNGNGQMLDRPAPSDGESGWYVHSKYAYSLLPFCAAISYDDLHKLGGFDERFGKGIGHADNDFVERVQNLGLECKVIDEPYCIHQWHTPTVYETNKFQRNTDLINNLRTSYPNRIYAPENKYFR